TSGYPKAREHRIESGVIKRTGSESHSLVSDSGLGVAIQTGSCPFLPTSISRITSQKLEATGAGGLFFDCLRSSAPHTGQSSQLSLDANDRDAQFLATSAGSA